MRLYLIMAGMSKGKTGIQKPVRMRHKGASFHIEHRAGSIEPLGPWIQATFY